MFDLSEYFIFRLSSLHLEEDDEEEDDGRLLWKENPAQAFSNFMIYRKKV